jgi:hypothetical protein
MPSSFLRQCPDCRTKLRVDRLDESVTCKCGTQLALPLKRSIPEQGRNPLEGLLPLVPNYD